MLKNKLIWIVLAILIMLSAWVAVFYLPSHAKISNLHKQLTDLKAKEKESALLAKVDVLSEIVDSLSQKLDVQNKRIYPESALLELGKAVEKLGSAYDLKLQSIAPDYDSLSALSGGAKELSDLRITVEFKGTFSHFTRFLDHIDTFPFAMIVQEVVFEKESTASQELRIQIQGRIVLRKERDRENSQERKNISNT
jgi:Tfp pilus assembly protein PilO